MQIEKFSFRQIVTNYERFSDKTQESCRVVYAADA